MTVAEAIDIDEYVFLYLAAPLREGETDRTGVFQGVCSPTDMVDWPANEPLDDAEPAWFRYNRIDLLFNSLNELNAAAVLLEEELYDLVLTLNTLDELGESEIIAIDEGGVSEP